MGRGDVVVKDRTEKGFVVYSTELTLLGGVDENGGNRLLGAFPRGRRRVGVVKRRVRRVPRAPNASSNVRVLVYVRVDALFDGWRVTVGRDFKRGGDGKVVGGPVGAEESRLYFYRCPSSIRVVLFTVYAVESSEGGVAESSEGGIGSINVSVEISESFLS